MYSVPSVPSVPSALFEISKVFLKTQFRRKHISTTKYIQENPKICWHTCTKKKKKKTWTSWVLQQHLCIQTHRQFLSKISHGKITEAPRLSLRIDGTPKIGAKCDFLPPLGILLEPRRGQMGISKVTPNLDQKLEKTRCPGHSMRWGHSTSLWDPPGMAL